MYRVWRVIMNQNRQAARSRTSRMSSTYEIMIFPAIRLALWCYRNVRRNTLQYDTPPHPDPTQTSPEKSDEAWGHSTPKYPKTQANNA